MWATTLEELISFCHCAWLAADTLHTSRSTMVLYSMLIEHTHSTPATPEASKRKVHGMLRRRLHDNNMPDQRHALMHQDVKKACTCIVTDLAC